MLAEELKANDVGLEFRTGELNFLLPVVDALCASERLIDP